jgi:hypothetical protein
MSRWKNHTKQSERIRLYLEQIEKLRMAQICMNNDLAKAAVQELVSLNRRFENEDHPHGN